MTRWPLVALTLPVVACISESRPRASSDATDATSSAPDATDDDGAGDADDPACASSGQTRCDDQGKALEVCLEGRWQSAPCGDDQICVGGAEGALCIDASGDADCHDTLYCFLACQVLHPDEGADQDGCFGTCFTAGTEQAQGELTEVIACFEDNCRDSAPLECAAQRCTQDLADCYYDDHGQAGCPSIVSCRIACEDDSDCAKRCGDDATIEAQGDYAMLELCIFYACWDQDEDCSRRATLPTGACSPYANECIGLLPNTPR